MNESAPAPAACKACRISVRIAPEQVQRILDEYLDQHPEPLVDARTYAKRMERCAACDDLVYGTTCRHCGCLVAVRARIARRACAAPAAQRWSAEPIDDAANARAHE